MEPRTNKAKSSSNWNKAKSSSNWKRAMLDKMKALQKNDGIFVFPPPDKNIVGSRWAYKIQVIWFLDIEVQTACSNLKAFLKSQKAHWVSQGYEKDRVEDYAVTFSPVAKMVPFAPAYIQHWPNYHPS